MDAEVHAPFLQCLSLHVVYSIILRKKLKDVTHVLGELPTKAIKLNLYWCDGRGCPRPQGRKVGPKKGTLRLK